MAAGEQIQVTAEGGVTRLLLAGAWTVAEAADLDRALNALKLQPARAATFDLSAIDALDTAGAWLIHRTARALEQAGSAVAWRGADARAEALLATVQAGDATPERKAVRDFGLEAMLERIGATTVFQLADARAFLGFIGLVLETAFLTLLRPARFRMTSFVAHLETVGLNALPIVGLISFLIGIVLAYQGASQLRLFGAEIFVVDMVAISVLREIGILLTAIVVAGRSGSAFTAQIGTMKLREETDAMRTLGLDPVEVLVLPRLFALVVAMPLLCFFADIMGLIGGGLMALVSLDLSAQAVIERIAARVTVTTFLIGMVKAPVFALMIALVGCYQGLRVRSDSDSVGRLTTRSVVQSIFLVIVVDAIFSIFFNLIGL